MSIHGERGIKISVNGEQASADIFLAGEFAWLMRLSQYLSNSSLSFHCSRPRLDGCCIDMPQICTLSLTTDLLVLDIATQQRRSWSWLGCSNLMIRSRFNQAWSYTCSHYSTETMLVMQVSFRCKSLQVRQRQEPANGDCTTKEIWNDLLPCRAVLRGESFLGKMSPAA